MVEEELQGPGPFEVLSPYYLCDTFRALSNAAHALNEFTNRQNYGPAIQQLIWDLGQVCENFGQEFDLAKLAAVLSKVCDHLEADDFNVQDDVDFKHNDLYLWDHTVTADQRLKYYKRRYPYDRVLNPVEEATDEV